MTAATETAPVIPVEGEAQAPTENGKAPLDPAKLLPWLPCELTLDVPVVHFTLGDLVHLKPGAIVQTAISHTSDIPLRVNRQLIGWTEFEVVGDRLAVRITELI
jgi:flagellar motor switch/type III secretory pathway protein FliN